METPSAEHGQRWPKWMGVALAALKWPLQILQILRQQLSFAEVCDLVILALQKDSRT